MRRRVLTLATILAFIISCSTTQEVKEDLYKDYKPKYELGDKKETEKEDKLIVDSSATNDEILSNENLKSVVFDRSDRQVNKDLKGVWVASVLNLDFPKTRGTENQKREIDNMMDNIKNWGLNAVFFHVRPAADALYKSENEPWSIYLTGVQDQDPGYDPLAYAIEAAHKRGLELHAWINPYRASMNLDRSKLSDRSVVKKHPEWIFEYDGKYYMNPGNPDVVRYVSNEIEYIVRNYDIDGMHLDDYFYPYPSSTLNLSDSFDDAEYEKNTKGFTDRKEWRRDNVDKMIQNLSVSVHKIKPKLSFGVSPFGIWRNVSSDPSGSNTKGLQAYDSLYADSVKWMREGWVDYIAPQIYWNIGFDKADYTELVRWWSSVSEKTNTPFYVGQGTYKASDWKNSDETARQLELNKNYKAVNGVIFFRYETLLNNPNNVREQIKNNLEK
ncbi:glycoside hydrolase family 10 protein [Pseudostreptobacillus hongkongensis]|uniref:glycoside hydrolase family 10 protein n=2 Tax=Leptotrichiaceae TaxID=1129771 RepID=UPI0008299577|nr:family 10 glycosylhydrolase [Pseudostreptobacillus hongkongensis]